MHGKYIYGIIDSSSEIALGISGLDTVCPVYTIAYRGVGCVLSDYYDGEFTSMSKKEVLRCLFSHQVVVEQVMRKHTVLPVKFGTVLATWGDVRGMLAQGHSQFVDALSRFQDKVEVEVAATWDTDQVLREISGEGEIVRTREAIASKPGQSLAERIRLGQMVKTYMDRRRYSYQERMIDFLKPLAADTQPNALVSDEMVMNVAFLVEKARQEEFDNRVGQLNSFFHDRINFRIIGPLPPYSFATVEVTKPSPGKLEEARQLLCLGEVISEPEVRRAYRHLAAETHPDSKTGDELATTRFIELRQASDLLIACCRSQAESGGSFSIDIKRLGTDEVQHLRFAEAGVAGGAGG